MKQINEDDDYEKLKKERAKKFKSDNEWIETIEQLEKLSNFEWIFTLQSLFQTKEEYTEYLKESQEYVTSLKKIVEASDDSD